MWQRTGRLILVNNYLLLFVLAHFQVSEYANCPTPYKLCRHNVRLVQTNKTSSVHWKIRTWKTFISLRNTNLENNEKKSYSTDLAFMLYDKPDISGVLSFNEDKKKRKNESLVRQLCTLLNFLLQNMSYSIRAQTLIFIVYVPRCSFWPTHCPTQLNKNVFSRLLC